MPQLKRLTVRGFKSIQALEDFELRRLNVLIGANGAGKSNFITLFQMLAAIVESRLQLFVQEHDGPDALLFGTRKRTPQMDVELHFGQHGYRITLKAAGDRLIFTREESWSRENIAQTEYPLGIGYDEARLPGLTENFIFALYLRPTMRSWRVYHFHDTSSSAGIRLAQPTRDNLVLKPDAANLAPYLRQLREQHPQYYQRIVQTIRLAAPFFWDFVYRPDVGERIDLEWFETGDPDTPFGPRQLSDGTLRFMALTTLLLQPDTLQPNTILIDEPELGLHPYALRLLVDMLKQASEKKQIIVSTQSVELVNALDPEDVIVANRRDGATTLQRLKSEELSDWLQEYALGELWQMNVLGGRPTSWSL